MKVRITTKKSVVGDAEQVKIFSRRETESIFQSPKSPGRESSPPWKRRWDTPVLFGVSRKPILSPGWRSWVCNGGHKWLREGYTLPDQTAQ